MTLSLYHRINFFASLFSRIEIKFNASHLKSSKAEYLCCLFFMLAQKSDIYHIRSEEILSAWAAKYGRNSWIFSSVRRKMGPVTLTPAMIWRYWL